MTGLEIAATKSETATPPKPSVTIVTKDNAIFALKKGSKIYIQDIYYY